MSFLEDSSFLSLSIETRAISLSCPVCGDYGGQTSCLWPGLGEEDIVICLIILTLEISPFAKEQSGPLVLLMALLHCLSAISCKCLCCLIISFKMYSAALVSMFAHVSVLVVSLGL